MMIIKNGYVFTESGSFQKANLCISGNIINCIKNDMSLHEKNAQILDAENCYVIPGLVDTHFHGCNNYDFSDCTIEAIKEICRYELSVGVTSIVPATMTLPINSLKEICSLTNSYIKKSSFELFSSKLLGIHLEGPFFAKEKLGAQNEKYLLLPDYEIIEMLCSLSGDSIKIISLAPELDNICAFTSEYINKGKSIHLSIGHTCATYSNCEYAFNNGFDRITHVYNAMKHYDDVIQSGIKNDAYCELICDGIHNDSNRIHNIFNGFSNNRVVLISDSMRATGMPDGIYSLGGQDVIVRGKVATLKSGQKAGSVTNLYDCMKNAIKMGIKKEAAIMAASYNAALSIGITDSIGLIKPGFVADILIVDQSFNIKTIIHGGKIAYQY